MFDDIIKNNVDSLLSKIGPLNSLKIDSLIEIESIPDSYRNMFVAEREIWTYKEKLKLAGNPFFAFSMDETHSLADYDSFLKGLAKVPYDDFPAFLQSMVQLRFNFLCRPRTTLKYFIFKESMSISFDEFLKYFAFFSDYEYLFQAFYDHIATQTELGKQNIGVYEFLQLINKFDDSHIFNIDSEAFIELVSPIFEFFNLGYPNDINLTANADALALFFDDKNMKYLSSVLQKQYKNQSISKTELISLFADALLPDRSKQDDFGLPNGLSEIAQSDGFEPYHNFEQTDRFNLDQELDQFEENVELEINTVPEIINDSSLDEGEFLNDYYINENPKIDESVMIKEIEELLGIGPINNEFENINCCDRYKEFPKFEPIGDIEQELENYISTLNLDSDEKLIATSADSHNTQCEDIDNEEIIAEPEVLDVAESIEAIDDGAERKKFAHIFDEASIEEIELSGDMETEDDFSNILNDLDYLSDVEIDSPDDAAIQLSEDDLSANEEESYDIYEHIIDDELLEETDTDLETGDDFSEVFKNLVDLSNEETESLDISELGIIEENFLANNFSSQAVSEFNFSLINSMKDYTSDNIEIDEESKTDIYFMNINNK